MCSVLSTQYSVLLSQSDAEMLRPVHNVGDTAGDTIEREGRDWPGRATEFDSSYSDALSDARHKG